MSVMIFSPPCLVLAERVTSLPVQNYCYLSPIRFSQLCAAVPLNSWEPASLLWTRCCGNFPVHPWIIILLFKDHCSWYACIRISFSTMAISYNEEKQNKTKQDKTETSPSKDPSWLF